MSKLITYDFWFLENKQTNTSVFIVTRSVPYTKINWSKLIFYLIKQIFNWFKMRRSSWYRRHCYILLLHYWKGVSWILTGATILENPCGCSRPYLLTLVIFCLHRLRILTATYLLLKRNKHHNSPVVCHKQHDFYLILTFFISPSRAANIKNLPNGTPLILLEIFWMLI